MERLTDQTLAALVGNAAIEVRQIKLVLKNWEGNIQEFQHLNLEFMVGMSGLRKVLLASPVGRINRFLFESQLTSCQFFSASVTCPWKSTTTLTKRSSTKCSESSMRNAVKQNRTVSVGSNNSENDVGSTTAVVGLLGRWSANWARDSQPSTSTSSSTPEANY